MSKIVDQITCSGAIGLTTSSTVLLGSMITGINRKSDWRDIVCWGMIGLVLSSRYVSTGKQWWF